MKVYKVELMVLDFDDIGADGIKAEIENTKYGNRCIVPEVRACEARDIGDWSDEHPLNHRDTSDAEYQRLFAAPAPGDEMDKVQPTAKPAWWEYAYAGWNWGSSGK